MIYSLGDALYIDKFVSIIDPTHELISYVFSRNHNVMDLETDKTYKDLSLLLENRNLKDIIMVDNLYRGVV